MLNKDCKCDILLATQCPVESSCITLHGSKLNVQCLAMSWQKWEEWYKVYNQRLWFSNFEWIIIIKNSTMYFCAIKWFYYAPFIQFP